MLITYIGHSGFLVETEEIYLVFDCVAPIGSVSGEQMKFRAGTMPKLDGRKEIVVFVSHRHEDHYSHAIWQLRKIYPHVKYVISKDVPFSPNVRKRLGLLEEDLHDILRAYGDQRYELKLYQGNKLQIETFYSTDEGVAYYLTLNGHTIYHAGDLHLWVWDEESAAYNKDMQNRFNRELEKLRGRKTDVAFLLLDPRQGKDAYRGMDAYLSAMNVTYAFPMHVWGKYEIISDYMRARIEKPYISSLQKIEREGQVFDCTV